MEVQQRDPAINIAGALRGLRTGVRDATTRLSANNFWRATHTPQGVGTIHLSWSPTTLISQAWGPGADWLLGQAQAMCGLADPGYSFTPDAHPVLLQSQRNHPGQRLCASGTLYHELLPAILGQRVTTIEATRQWAQLSRKYGQVAPGPDPTLRLPPHPDLLAQMPAWSLHPLGIEAKRANALQVVAKHAARIQEWSCLAPADAAHKLQLLPGIGSWTAAVAGGPAFGDPDAVPVGDFHLPSLVSWAMERRPRGTDERMLELLAPYAGQRGRALQLLSLSGLRPPKFGPRQRIQPMHRR